MVYQVVVDETSNAKAQLLQWRHRCGVAAAVHFSAVRGSQKSLPLRVIEIVRGGTKFCPISPKEAFFWLRWNCMEAVLCVTLIIWSRVRRRW